MLTDFRKVLRRGLVIAGLVASSLVPAFGVNLHKPATRKPASPFELKNAEGRSVRLSDFKGKIVVIDFWATWCLPCKAAIPWMNELAAKYRQQGVEILGISMDDEGWDVVRPFIHEMDVRYPILMGDKQVGDRYGEVDSLPVAFFVDRNQKVAGVHVGAASREQFEAAIQALLKGK